MSERQSYILNFSADEFWGNPSAVCPYCKHKQTMDDFSSNDQDIHEYLCESCGKTFHVQTIISTSYSSTGDCEKNGDLPHELVKQWPDEINQYKCTKCKGDIYKWQMEGDRPRIKEGQFVINEAKREDIF